MRASVLLLVAVVVVGAVVAATDRSDHAVSEERLPDEGLASLGRDTAPADSGVPPTSDEAGPSALAGAAGPQPDRSDRAGGRTSARDAPSPTGRGELSTPFALSGDAPGQTGSAPGGSGTHSASAGADDVNSVDIGPAPGFEPAAVTAEGFHVVPGTATAGEGRRVTYTVEVEPGVPADPLAVAATVEQALGDARSWANDVEVVRVDSVAEATVRVVLAHPDTVDELCVEAGLETRGRFSCWNGTFAALNAVRWDEGAPAFVEISTYRRYLVNHEFGHGLGYGHVACPEPRGPAPVMQQQSISTGDCVANGWVYPERSSS